MSLLTIVAATYNQGEHKLPAFVHSLLGQSWADWRAIIIHDGPSTDGSKEFMDNICQKYPGFITYLESETRENCWGHQNRAWGQSLVETPWLMHTSADCQFIWEFIHELSGDLTSGNFDVITWKTAHSYFAFRPFFNWFGLAQCDLGQFCVRTEMAKSVGFNHRVHHADGLFIEDLKRGYPNMRIGHRDSVLTVHN